MWPFITIGKQAKLILVIKFRTVTISVWVAMTKMEHKESFYIAGKHVTSWSRRW